MKDINTPVPTAKRSGKLIQDVKEGKPLEFDKSGFLGFLKSLNPLQFASETIAQLVHYKHQIKILETEQKRIEAEAGIRHHQIDAALQAGLQLLAERRVAMQMALQVVSKDLENSHLEKKRILDCIDNLVKNITDPGLSFEEKQLSHTAIAMFTETLKGIGEQSIIKLDLIAKNTQKALEAMPRSDLILTFSDGE
ncbi:hypothetical protein [Pseudomonas sp. Irchel 3A7]|uniref:hypothetical protein n=1 Tax=Pseudomonas sp. Irchel 3A7 TaxID=2008913 RepID=UPI000BA3F54B|nr:hypothetical protein [Pseudomonas sp. Irchel 3A7]